MRTTPEVTKAPPGLPAVLLAAALSLALLAAALSLALLAAPRTAASRAAHSFTDHIDYVAEVTHAITTVPSTTPPALGEHRRSASRAAVHRPRGRGCPDSRAPRHLAPRSPGTVPATAVFRARQ
jgi:hypothetical protein